MSFPKEEKKLNIYNINEVKKWCDHLNCTPYHLFIAYKKVGGNYNNLKSYFERSLGVNAVGN